MEAAYVLFVLLSNLLLIKALTHPLPDEEGKIMHNKVSCGTGKEFEWEKTEPAGNDIKMTYTCAGATNTKSFACKNGYKAHSKRDAICNPGPDPNFGIFREGKDPNVMDSASVVYFCMKASENSLPPC